MANFNQHRTQVAIDRMMSEPDLFIFNKIDSTRLLVKAKEQMMDNFSRDLERKVESNTNYLKQQFEDQYGAKIQGLEETASQQETQIREQENKIAKKERKIGRQERKINKQEDQIEEHSQKISTLKEQIANHIKAIGDLEEEQKRRESKMEKEKAEVIIDICY